MATQTDPRCLPNVALRVKMLQAAVKFITKLIKGDIHVKTDSIDEGLGLLNRIVFHNLVHENFKFSGTTETEIFRTLGGPRVQRHDDRRHLVLHLNGAQLTVLSNVCALLVHVGRLAATLVAELSLAVHRTILVAARTYSGVDHLSATNRAISGALVRDVQSVSIAARACM